MLIECLYSCQWDSVTNVTDLINCNIKHITSNKQININYHWAYSNLILTFASRKMCHGYFKIFALLLLNG